MTATPPATPRLTTAPRVLALTVLAVAALGAFSIAAVDGPLAVRLARLSPEIVGAIQAAVSVVELVFAFPISPYLYSGLLVLGGLALRPWRKDRRLPWALLFIGLTHSTARFLADILKPPFSRLRPYEALTAGAWSDIWFAPAGNSFPSGHAVHFWGLFFPLVVLFPRFAVPLALLPVLVSTARIAVNDHYLSDIFASVAVAAAVTGVYAVTVLGRGSSGRASSVRVPSCNAGTRERAGTGT